jgi:hypothetical protein
MSRRAWCAVRRRPSARPSHPVFRGAFATRTGEFTSGDLIRSLIEEGLDDLDDRQMAKDRLNRPLRPLTGAQVRQRLAWTIEHDPRAIDDLKRLSREIGREIVE